MPLRTVALLLLCVSMGMCATIGHYQDQASEDEEPAVVTEGGVAAASVEAGEEGVAPVETHSPAAEEPAANSIFGDNLLAKIFAGDNPAADKPEVDVPVADGATAEKQGTDSDGPAGDAPGMEALTGEAVAQEQPSSSEDNDIRPVHTNQSPNKPLAQEDDNSWSLNSIRSTFQTMNGYFDSLVELAGGHNGVCQYRCRYGELPQPRPGYQLPEPNGCSSSLVGFQVNAALDLGIPAMTKCCNQLDMCYDTCGTSKNDCDAKFRTCLYGICSDLKKSLGFVSKVQACESMADALHSTVGTLGCRPYMNSQRAACVCEGEERDEL
ncbi:group XIIB secretory phospholipase A2-like protein isoform X1 [Epinephelus fuscoguttatus]|uniref:group XIIB secretory phospholipase A2-like protein isoform X1 n=1 Tax=Epinephelus fuscoguttatus TaxID=293821 RepID=UPI0020D18D33|nr:group XIIB secretory phospholipase A2-like protein isoform X1 [Epinephelus fuscoguttatus]